MGWLSKKENGSLVEDLLEAVCATAFGVVVAGANGGCCGGGPDAENTEAFPAEVVVVTCSCCCCCCCAVAVGASLLDNGVGGCSGPISAMLVSTVTGGNDAATTSCCHACHALLS